MAARTRMFWAVAALFALATGTAAQCMSYGVDYSNGGSYYIDGTSNDKFAFLTVFQGCNSESVEPALVDPNGKQYACSAIQTVPAGAQTLSTCNIQYSRMWSGDWKIIVSSKQIGVQRVISLTVGFPETETITATRTIVVGYTTTPPPLIVYSTISQTQTLILAPSTITTGCTSPAKTITTPPPPTTVVQTSTVTRTTIGGVITSVSTITKTTTASCRFTRTTTTGWDQPPGVDPQPSFCIGNGCQPFWTTGRGWGLCEPGEDGRCGFAPAAPTPAAKAAKFAAAMVEAYAAVAATTVTYTQTTYTVTMTSTTTAAQVTKTEPTVRTITSYSTPAPYTVCRDGVQPGKTITVTGGNPSTITRSTISYTTTEVFDTIFVGTTSYSTYSNQASASACWRAGGSYGV